MARAWVDGSADGAAVVSVLAATPDVPVAALAWALKDEAMAAWGTAPVRALRCAAGLDALHRQHGSDEVGAAMHWTRGLAALTDGRMADAIDGFDRAQAGLLALQRPHEAAQTQVPKMIALAMTGRQDEAEACGDQALAAFVLAGDHRSAGKVELNLGTMLSRRDRHAEAAPRLRRAAVHAARAEDLELSIRADIALADALTWLSDFDEALRINQRASTRAQTHGLAVLSALAKNAIGRIEINRGAFPEALREIASASRLLAEVGAPVQQRIEVDKALADAYAAVHLLPEARAIYDRVIGMAQTLGTVSEEARARVQRARVARQQGDRSGAEADFEAARLLFERDGNKASVAFVDLAIASMRLDAGDAAAARQAAAALVERLAPIGKRGWWFEARVLQAAAAAADGDLKSARDGYEALLAEAQLATQLRFAGHHGLAALAWRERQEAPARHHLDLAMSQLDDLRAALPGDIFRSAVGAAGEAVHDLLVRIAVDSGQAAPVVLQAIERGHARALSFAAAQPGDDGGAASAQRTALQWTRGRQREALERGDSARVVELEAQAIAQEQALLEAHRRALLASEAGSAPVAVGAAPESGGLRAGQAIVVFHRLAERLIACVSTEAGVSALILDAGGLEARLDALRLQLDTMRLPGAAQRHGAVLLQRARTHLQALHTMLWAPLEAALAGCRRVVIVPHGRLHYLPFAALHDGRHWLVENRDISLAPSAGLAQRALAGTPRLPRSVLAVGRGGAGLQHVYAEASDVAAAFGGASTALLGADATVARVREAAPSADVVHLACHGVFRADNPMFSALELADGPFTLFDAQQLGWRAALVTLSACETGVSRVAPGNESIGLVRGFLLAGAAGVVASMWAVDDAATAALMRSFYARLRAGDGAAAALGAAQREMACGGAHPFHWAAFALHGQG